MTKSLAITLGSILLVCLGIFSVMQVKKLDTTKNHLSEKLSNITMLEENLAKATEDKNYVSGLNSDLESENQVLRDSIVKLNRVIVKLRKKVGAQNRVIEQLRNKVNFLQSKYDQKKQEIAILSRKDEDNSKVIAKIEAEKAEIKKQITQAEVQEQNSINIKLVTENEIKETLDSQDQFQKIVDVVNNTRIKFQDIKIKMDKTGRPVTRLISEGKNWRHTTIEFFMKHNNNKVLLDEQFLVKIVDIDNQKEIQFIQPNPLTPQESSIQEGAPFFFDGNLVEINHVNSQPKQGRNFEIQVFYKSDDGEEYLLLDGVKQFIQNGNVVSL